MRKSHSFEVNRWTLPVFVGLVVLLCLGAGELVQRARAGGGLRYSEAKYSPHYHHLHPSNRKKWAEIRTDPEAFRGETTIAVIGDSFVQGLEVEEDERFTSVLQNRLGEAGLGGHRVVNLGQVSHSVITYRRLYEDIVEPLDPDIVLILLDQTDGYNDVEYEAELGPDGLFIGTKLAHLESFPIRFWLLKHSRLALSLDRVLRSTIGRGLIPERQKRTVWPSQLEIYFEVCRDPAAHPEIFQTSLAHLEAILAAKPDEQRLIIVTYPRAENISGQLNTTASVGAIPEDHESMPFFEYWIRTSKIAEAHPRVEFLHLAADFRRQTEATDEVLYFHENDVHWNPRGHAFVGELLAHYLLASKPGN